MKRLLDKIKTHYILKIHDLFDEGIIKKDISKINLYGSVAIALVFLIMILALPTLNYNKFCPNGKYIFNEEKKVYDSNELLQVLICTQDKEIVQSFSYDFNLKQKENTDREILTYYALNFWSYPIDFIMKLVLWFMIIVALSNVLVEKIGDSLKETFMWVIILFVGAILLSIYLKFGWGRMI